MSLDDNCPFSNMIITLNEKVMDIRALKLFVSVAEKGSFSEAARHAHVSAAAATRAVAAIEDEVGVPLLRRSTRSVALTEAGATYLMRARHALDDLDQAALEARGERSEPRGLLTIAAPIMFGRLHVRPIVSALLAKHPELRVQLTLSDRVTRIVDEGFDAAFRIAELPDSALHAIRLSEVRRVLVASPDYLARAGTPLRITDLPSHDLIGFEAQMQGGDWRFAGTKANAVHVDPRLWVNDALAAIDAAVAGDGITRVLSYQVREQIHDGRLVRILDEAAPAPVPISLVYASKRASSANLRALIAESRKQVSALDLAFSRL